VSNNKRNLKENLTPFAYLGIASKKGNEWDILPFSLEGHAKPFIWFCVVFSGVVMA
jgi:hypothetical protein